MAMATDKTPGGTSPRTYALNHARPKTSFYGCSRIGDYELQGKLGEGTFGYGPPQIDKYTNATLCRKARSMLANEPC